MQFIDKKLKTIKNGVTSHAPKHYVKPCPQSLIAFLSLLMEKVYSVDYIMALRIN